MAPQMSKTAAAAAVVAGTAFVSLPTHRSAPTTTPTLRGRSAGQASTGSSMLSTVGVAALGVTVAALRRDANAARKVERCAFENELGVQAPLGFWDPAGLSSDGDAKEFYRRRVVEIKHGRVSMLACTGYIVQEFFRFPGYISPSSEIKFADIPNGLAAATKVPAVGWFQYTVFCGICDLWLMHQVPTNPPGKLCTRLFGEETTNYEYGFLGLPGYLGGKAIADPEVKKKKLNAEIANGRLAMMAIIGMFFQDGLTGSAWGDWANYTESPLRAFENELGVQPPLGFWDPAGLSSDGDAKEFYRRRVVEIKHGRVSMLACTGYIVQEFFRFPGYISPSSEIKFADIPNGLAAATKVPAVGWFQYTVFCGICDLWLMHQVPTNPPGKLCTRLFGEETTNYEYGFLGLPGYLGGKAIADPEVKKKKLNAEIANGRLAMMAIIGMFFQDGLTGSAWGDWANYTESPLRAFENELGVQAPVGYFDPMGLSKDGDVETFRRRREAELKNGRVAMFATIGYMVPEYFKFPGYLAPSSNLKFADVPNGIAAITKVPAEGWLQWVALCGCYEFCVNTPVDPAEPGNYGKGKLGYGNMVLGITAEPMQDAEARKRALNSELANGRLAMMAIVGLWVQDGLFGTPYGLYTGSNAFETELGVQPPVGFWDPLGFTKTDDVASFRRRRYVELKHGRVAMFACLGYIVPEYYRWPGDLSPSLGLKFSDVPTGFAAFSKVPLSGWAQMVAFAGTVELFQYVDDPKRPPGDFENAGFLGVPNSYVKAPAGTKEKKLAAEIANGRLAMMAIIGMFFQNGLTGEAWGSWSLYTDSPLRALSPAQEAIAGTGGPFGDDFWDPAGITNGKSKEEILQLRAMELKHGRVAMLAVLGWFHVAAGYHIVGDYAVGEHLDNNPLVNLTQMPMGGIWQVVFTIMCLEWVTTYVCKPPEEKPWDILGWTDILIEDEKSIWNQFGKAQLQELNNGRLAMMGITGLIAQDVLFGDFGEAAVLPCFGAAACKELFSPVGPESTTEPFLGAGFIYPPLAQ